MNLGMAESCLLEAIRGRIGDPLGLPVASARVVLSGSRLARKIGTRTSAEGHFMFICIPPGVYTLEVSCAGFGRLVQRGIAVQKHAITGLDLKMDFAEDSRSLKLRALSLEYVVDEPKTSGVMDAGRLARHLRDTIAGLSLDRALFHPPAAARVGQRLAIEFGAYQNLKETILRSLGDLHGDGLFSMALIADLRVTGCRVFSRSPSRLEVDGARYMAWGWEIVPHAFGKGLLCLELSLTVDFKGVDSVRKCLMTLERGLVIRKDPWRFWRRWLRRRSQERNGDALS